MEELTKIPWWGIFTNFVWIFGASIILADFSYHEFLSHQKKTPLIKVLKKSSFKTPFFWGVFLIAGGISLSVKNPWLAGIFGGTAIFILVFLLRKIKAKKLKI